MRQNVALVTHLSYTQISLGLAGAVTLVAYGLFIVAPAWGSYGRLWEKIAASFLTLFILAALVGIGVGVGAGIIYLYIRGA